jgi:hypothetical protein
MRCGAVPHRPVIAAIIAVQVLHDMVDEAGDEFLAAHRSFESTEPPTRNSDNAGEVLRWPPA